MELEKEAYLQGNITFRNWEDKVKNVEKAIDSDKIECDECGWSWKIADGGNDLFICHKCGHDNKPTGK
jgi:ribosomal protein L37AE/L43A